MKLKDLELNDPLLAVLFVEASYPRRRAVVSTPRRRAVRRRAPPPPVPAPVATRRRTTSISGNTYTTTGRRRAPVGQTDVRRRRSVSYGYTSRPQMMNNFGGNSAVPSELSPMVGTLSGLNLRSMYCIMCTINYSPRCALRYHATTDQLWIFGVPHCPS